MCVSSGSEWVLEDTIHLKNIHLPRIQVDPHLDLSYLYDSRFLQKKQRLNHIMQTFSSEDVRSPLKNGDQNDHHTNLHKTSGGMYLLALAFLSLGFVAGVHCSTLAFRDETHQMSKVIKRFGKHCSCHLRGESGQITFNMAHP
jgi:hypothetical protein